MARSRPYHHGKLRRALMDAALEDIAERGADALSLRELAKRLGVSHGAPAHHFGDRAGLLTAIAIEALELLRVASEPAARERDFLELGLAYVRFALEHPAHFQVLYQPSLYRSDDPAFLAERARSATALYSSAATMGPAGDAADVGLAGWCLMHGFATLWLSGNLGEPATDPIELARTMAMTTFARPGEPGGAAITSPPARPARRPRPAR